MLRCPDEIELERYLAETTTAEERARLTRHLGDCPTCSAWLQEALRDEALVSPVRRALAGAPPWRADDGPVPSLAGFRIRRRLGAGGMGVVYEAEELHPPREVAVKVLASLGPRARRRFEVEVEALARLEHEGIARLFSAGTFAGPDGEHPYLVLELVRGRPLRDHLAAERPGLRARLELFLRIAEAVEHAHQKGVVHRDLKPANVLVTADGRPKVLDFGIARLGGGAGETEVGQLLGTLAHMSPEQASGDPGSVDTRSDVYSLGVLLYELLTGELPHDLEGRTAAEALRAVALEEPVAPRVRDPALARDLEAIVLHALRKRPDERYPSVAELASDLRRFLRHEPVLARATGLLGRATRFVRRHTGLVGATALVVVSLAAGLWSTARESRRARAAEADALVQVGRLGDVVGFFKALYGGADPDNPIARPVGITLREALDETAAALEGALASDPEVEAELRVVLGNAYGSLGLDEAAQGHLERALALRRARFGEGHREVGESCNALAALAVGRGEHERAEEWAREALACYADELPQGHVAIATARITLGSALLGQKELPGKVAEARAVLEAAVAAFEAAPGRAQGNHAVALSALAGALRAEGRRAESDELFERALALHRSALGPDHPFTRIVEARRGYALFEDKDVAGALALLRPAAESLERTRGVASPHTRRATTALAEALLAAGELDAADAAVRRSPLEGPWQTRVQADVDMALGSRHLARGEAVEAEARYRSAAELRAAALGPEHRGVHSANVQRATALCDLARFDEARALQEAALEALAADPTVSPRTLRAVRNNLATTLCWLEELEAARAILALVLEEALAEDPTGSSATVARHNLARVLGRLGEVEEAEALQGLVVDAWTAELGPEHANTLVARRNLAEIALAAGRAEEARDELERLVALARAGAGITPQRLSELLLDYGRALSALEDERASSILREGRDLAAEAYPATHPAVRAFDEALGGR